MQESIPVTTQTAFPVVDKEGNYLALFSLNQIRRVIYEKEFGKFAIVADVAIHSVEPFRLDTDLSAAVADFARLEYDELPVADAEGKKILGLLRRQDLLAVYIPGANRGLRRMSFIERHDCHHLISSVSSSDATGAGCIMRMPPSAWDCASFHSPG